MGRPAASAPGATALPATGARAVPAGSTGSARPHSRPATRDRSTQREEGSGRRLPLREAGQPGVPPRALARGDAAPAGREQHARARMPRRRAQRVQRRLALRAARALAKPLLLGAGARRAACRRRAQLVQRRAPPLASRASARVLWASKGGARVTSVLPSFRGVSCTR